MPSSGSSDPTKADSVENKKPYHIKYTWLWGEILVWVVAVVFFVVNTCFLRDTLGYPNMYVQDIIPATSKYMPVLGPVEFRKEDLLDGRMNLTKLYASNQDHDNVLANVGLTVFAAAKYSAMCFGNREPWHLALRFHSETMHQHNSADPADITELIWGKSAGKDGQLVRALLLEKWQRETQGEQKLLQSRSMCACMDSMHAAAANTAGYNTRDKYAQLRDTFRLRIAALWAGNATAQQTRLRSYLENDYFDYNITHDVMLHESRAFLPAIGSVQTNLERIVADMRPSNLLETSEQIDTPGILEFCDGLSVPSFSVDFLGRMDSWIYIVVGQALLLITCWYNFQLSYMYWANMNHVKSAPKNGYTWSTPKIDETVHVSVFHLMLSENIQEKRWYLQGIMGVRWFLIVATLVCAWSLERTPLDRFKNTERIALKDTSANSNFEVTRFSPTTNIDGIYFGILTVTLVFVAVLEVGLARYMFKMPVIPAAVSGSNPTGNQPANADAIFRMTRIRVLYTVVRDLMNILALTTIAVGVALQMGAQYIVTIVVSAGVVFVAGVAQHVANLLNIIFDFCAVALIEKVTFSNVMDNLKPDDHRHVMLRRICLVRLFTYGFVLLSSVFLVTQVGVTKVHSAASDTKNALGVFLAVLVFSVLSAYEFVFDFFNSRNETDVAKVIAGKMNDRRWLHCVVVCVYVILASSMSAMMR